MRCRAKGLLPPGRASSPVVPASRVFVNLPVELLASSVPEQLISALRTPVLIPEASSLRAEVQKAVSWDMKCPPALKLSAISDAYSSAFPVIPDSLVSVEEISQLRNPEDRLDIIEIH